MPLELDDVFYYQEKSEGFLLTNEPGGEFDVNEFTRSRPYWRHPALTSGDKKQKSLLLTDWTAPDWSQDKIAFMQVMFQALLTEGFSLYAWQDGEVVQLSEETLGLLTEKRFRDRITPVLPQDAIQASVRQHRRLVGDQIHLLDDYQIHYLQNGAYPVPRVLAFGPNYKNLKQFELRQLIDRANPPYTVFCKQFIEEVDESTSHFHHLVQRYPEVKTAFSILSSSVPEWGKLRELAKESTTLSNLEKLDLSRSGGVPADVLSALLAASPSLKNLGLGGIGSQTFNAVIPQFDWTALQSFKLKGNSELTWGELKQALLDKTTQLNSLTLEHTTNLLVDFNTTPNLHGLTSLTLYSVALNLASLSQLNQLEELIIHSIPHDLETTPPPTLYLPNLKSLALELNIPITATFFNGILANTTALKSLSMAKNTDIAAGFSLELDFSTLEILNVEASNISSAPDLDNLLDGPLRELNLNKVKTLMQGFALDHDFTKLEVLKCGESNIHPDDLCHILTKARNLKTLDLSGLTLPRDFFKGLDLSHLESLNISNITLSPDDLIALLRKSDKLRELNLMGVENLRANFTQHCSMPRLEKLHIFSSNITLDDLSRLAKGSDCLHFIGILPSHLQTNPQARQIWQEVRDIGVSTEKTAASSSQQTAASRAIPDPVHNLNEFKEWKPTPPDAPFEFKNDNPNRNQMMIISKLSQYLTVTGQHLSYIPRMQDGICSALANVFLIDDDKTWESRLTLISDWNGEKGTITPALDEAMEDLWQMVAEFQFSPAFYRKPYIGDNIADFLMQHPRDYVLASPWHAITVKYQGADNWLVYDPLFKEGKGKRCKSSDLKQLITQQLGGLVAVDLPSVSWKPAVDDPNQFIKEGGLLALCSFENMFSIPRQIQSHPISADALSGILLRDLKGHPVWAEALKVPTLVGMTLFLLEAFIQHLPKHYKTPLQHSLEVLTAENRHDVIARLRALPNADPKLINTLCDLLRQRPNRQPDFEKRLETWVRQTPTINTPQAFCQQLVQAPGKKQLVEIANNDDLQAMQCLLQKHCQDSGRDYFYIDSPKDLICSADYIQREGDCGRLARGPGGPLHDFLTAPRAPGNTPVLIVNYDNFSAEDLILFNRLLAQDNPEADGTALPESTTIVGLVNPNKPGFTQDGDFYADFDHKHHCPFQGEALAGLLPPLPETLEQTGQGEVVIDLYHAIDWKARLLGRWVLKDNQLFYEEGQLLAALNQGSAIVLQNAPWHDAAFVHFWQQACFLQRIKQDGREIKLPLSAQFYQRNGYDWQVLTANCRFEAGLQAGATVVNPGCLGHCFSQYHCNNDTHALTAIPGFIANQTRGSDWHVNITRSLTTDQWAMLLDACQQQGIVPHFHLAAGVSLPAELPSVSVQRTDKIDWDLQTQAATLVIDSNDPDSTVSLITRDNTDWLVIEISECQASDLLLYLESRYTPTEPIPFHFTEQQRALITALQAGKHVLLKGQFKPALVDALAPLLLARQQAATPPGKLVLVTSRPATLAFMQPVRHTVDEACKRECLASEGYPAADIDHLTVEQWQQEPLSRLATRLAFVKAHPGQSSDKAWRGLEGRRPRFEFPAFDPVHSAENARAFNENRRQAVNAVLAAAPYVFLTGLTAVGKTEFVERVLIDKNDTLYRGEQSIEEWAQDMSDKRKILFIDEANLSPRQWSEFEGLFNKPPSILINGRVLPLSDQHKVVFAGNPLSYGEGRTLAPFFQRHGNALTFEPMPPDFIYEAVLKPVFDGTPFTDQAVAIATPLLEVYRFLCQHSTSEVLISPRELQMMALLTLSTLEQHPSQNPQAVAKYYAYQLAKALVPLQQQRGFNQQFTANLPDFPGPSQEAMGAFPVTESRKDAVRQLDEWLALHDRRQTVPGNDAQRFGGLGGIILESSSPAITAELVIARLVARGFEQTRLHDTVIPEKPFYRMPLSMQLADKKKLLLKAFDEGAVVLIDEINSCPMMERYLNDLLMGKNPEARTGQPLRPRKPGFMVIGTQQPAALANRIKPSNALARRFTTITLDDYSVKELRAILVNKGVLAEDAKAMVAAWEIKVKQAQQKQLKPPPTLKDLWRLARDTVRSQTVAQIIDEQELHYITDDLHKAQTLIADELRRLNRANKLSVQTGLPSLQAKKITALEELVQALSQSPAEGQTVLQDWYATHYQDFCQQANPIKTFFSPGQRSSSQLLVGKLCEIYQVDEADLQTSMGAASSRTANKP